MSYPVAAVRGKRSKAPFTPLSLSSALVGTIDIPAAMARGGLLWQDAGKTVPAVELGDPIAVAVCPYTGAEWAKSGTSPTLQYDQGGRWCVRGGGAGGLVLTVNASLPLTTVFRWAGRNAAGGFNIPFSGGSNAIGVGYDASGGLFNFTATGFTAASQYTRYAPATITAYTATSGAYLRKDGVSVATGTNTAASVTKFTLFANGSGGSWYQGELSRLLIASRQLTASEQDQSEAWAAGQTALGTARLLFFGFRDQANEDLAVYSTQNIDEFTEIVPGGSRFTSSTGSLRDPVVCRVSTGLSGLLLGYTVETLHPAGRLSNGFGLAHCTSWPLGWTEDRVVDCSDVTTGSGNCWFSDLYYESGTLYALFCANQGTASQKLYWKTSADGGATWAASVQMTGSVIPSNAIDAHLRKIGGVYHLIGKDETAKTIWHATRSTLAPTGWNTDGGTTGLTDPIEGFSDYLTPQGRRYCYLNEYSGGSPVRFRGAADLSSFAARVVLATLSGTTVQSNGFACPDEI